MKKTIILTLVALFFMSCGGDSSEDNSSNGISDSGQEQTASSSTKEKENSSGISDLFKGASTMKNMAEALEGLEEKGKKLKELTPMSNANMKKLLPETLNGYPRKKFSVGSGRMIGLAQGEAEYEVDKKTRSKLKLSIIDGAGEAGSAMVNMMSLAFTADFEEENESGYSKSTTINGYKAMEEVKTRNNKTNSEFTLLVADRFLVKMEGKNVDVAEVKKAIDQLDFKTLESVAGE